MCVCVCVGGGGGERELGTCSLILCTKHLIPPSPVITLGIANDPAIFKDSLPYLKISQDYGVLISILLTERG